MKKGKNNKRFSNKNRRDKKNSVSPTPLSKYNWNTIDCFLTKKGWITDTETRNVLKNYYLRKSKPNIRVFPFVRSIIDRSEISNVIDTIKNNDREKDWYIEYLLDLQERYQFTFGDNSLFARQESKILDELEYPSKSGNERFRESLQNVLERKKNKKRGLSTYLMWRHRIPLCDRYTLADHIQFYRTLDEYEVKILSITDNFYIDEIDDLEKLLYLGVAVAAKHPEIFDKNLLRLSERLNSIISNKDNPEVVQEFYYQYVESKLDSHIESSTIGGQLTAFVKYGNAVQRDSMVNQISSQTRYPMCQFPGEDVLHHLKMGEGWTSVSRGIVNGLWKCGFTVDEHHLVEENGLLVHNENNLNLLGRLPGYDLLGYDASLIKDHYSYTGKVTEKEDISECEYFPGVVVVQNLVGRVFVKLLGPNLAPIIPIDECNELSKIYSEYSNIDEFSMALCSASNYSTVKKKTFDLIRN